MLPEVPDRPFPIQTGLAVRARRWVIAHPKTILALACLLLAPVLLPLWAKLFLARAAAPVIIVAAYFFFGFTDPAEEVFESRSPDWSRVEALPVGQLARLDGLHRLVRVEAIQYLLWGEPLAWVRNSGSALLKPVRASRLTLPRGLADRAEIEAWVDPSLPPVLKDGTYYADINGRVHYRDDQYEEGVLAILSKRHPRHVNVESLEGRTFVRFFSVEGKLWVEHGDSGPCSGRLKYVDVGGGYWEHRFFTDGIAVCVVVEDPLEFFGFASSRGNTLYLTHRTRIPFLQGERARIPCEQYLEEYDEATHPRPDPRGVRVALDLVPVRHRMRQRIASPAGASDASRTLVGRGGGVGVDSSVPDTSRLGGGNPSTTGAGERDFDEQ